MIGEGYFVVADSPEATPLTDSSEIVTMTVSIGFALHMYVHVDYCLNCILG